MLTSIYYFNLYKPYIMATRETNKYAPKRSRIADKKAEPMAPPSAKGQDFILNKTVKSEIVNYAKDVSGGINNLRTSAYKAQQGMGNFNHLVRLEGWDYALNSLSKDFSKFSKQYNESTDFLQNQNHSANLRTFSNELTDNLYYNRDRLGALGFSFTEDGRLNYDRSVIDGMSHNKINIVIGENKKIFNDVRRQAERSLTEPMVDHMNFKGLGYHYNYKLGMMKADGFNLLEVGMLIDEVV